MTQAPVGVDPELLHARVAAVSDHELRDTLERVVEGAFAVLTELGALPLSSLEARAAEEGTDDLWDDTLQERLEALTGHVDRLCVEMEPLATATEADATGLDDVAFGDEATDEPTAVELDDAGDVVQAQDEPATGQPPDAVADPDRAVKARVGELFSVMRFFVGGESKRFQTRTPALRQLEDGWEAVNALQDYVAATRSGLSALLVGVFAGLPALGGETSSADDHMELLAACELRLRVFDLRESVQDAERLMRSEPSSGWKEPLDRVKRLLSAFVSGPGFAWMRAGDKRSVIKLASLIDDVLAMWSPLRAAPALQAVESLARYLEALEVINQREVLVAHDRKCLATVAEMMARAASVDGAEARRCIAAGLAALAEAQGRDPDLDALMAASMSPDTPVPVEEILLRAEEVLRQLGG